MILEIAAFAADWFSVSFNTSIWVCNWGRSNNCCFSSLIVKPMVRPLLTSNVLSSPRCLRNLINTVGFAFSHLWETAQSKWKNFFTLMVLRNDVLMLRSFVFCYKTNKQYHVDRWFYIVWLVSTETSNIANKTVSNSQFTHTHIYCSSFFVHIHTHSWDKPTQDLAKRSLRNRTLRIGLYNCLLDDFFLTIRELIIFKKQTKKQKTTI